jgi:DNA adenine methylase
MKQVLVKSPMNYTGGKYKLLPQILPLFPNNGNIKGQFIDLFCGGVNVAANVTAKRIIANDFDKNVIGIYSEFKRHMVEDIISHIERRIKEYELSITNKEGFDNFRLYYNSCENKNPLDLFVLICFSFNHQFRFNSKGEFNMPFGKDKSCFNNTIKRNLINFKTKIDGIIFTNRSFEELNVEKLTADDFVYCDPPYLITCATYNEKDGWNEIKERQLLALLDNLNDNGIKFALSNVLFSKGKTNDILYEWSNKYNVYHLNNTYANSNYHTKDKSTKADEVLITNYPTENNAAFNQAKIPSIL